LRRTGDLEAGPPPVSPCARISALTTRAARHMTYQEKSNQ